MSYYIAELGSEDKKYYIIYSDIYPKIEKIAHRLKRPDIFFLHPSPMFSATPVYNFILSLRDVYPHPMFIHNEVCDTRRDVMMIKEDIIHYLKSLPKN